MCPAMFRAAKSKSFSLRSKLSQSSSLCLVSLSPPSLFWVLLLRQEEKRQVDQKGRPFVVVSRRVPEFWGVATTSLFCPSRRIPREEEGGKKNLTIDFCLRLRILEWVLLVPPPPRDLETIESEGRSNQSTSTAVKRMANNNINNKRRSITILVLGDGTFWYMYTWTCSSECFERLY